MLRGLFPAHADWLINDVIIQRGRLLGSGAYGEVRQATWKGCPVAAKRLHDIFFQPAVVPEEVCRRMVAEFAAECSLQAQLRHPNIVPLYGVYLPPGGEDGAQAAPVMITELMAETLRSRINRVPRLTTRDVVDLSLDIASGLRFLHEREAPIGHRDLSANNVMISSGGACKIGDVGLAKVFTPARRLATTMKPGAELYMPGEVLTAHARYNEKIDVFSLGVLMMEMALGHEPRPQPDFTTEEVVNGERMLRIIPESRRRRAELDELGEQHPLRPLIERLLLPQADRPAIGEVFGALEELRNHPAYVNSPSTLGSAEVVSARLASDLQNVQEIVTELSRRQLASDERLQQFEQQHNEQLQVLHQEVQQRFVEVTASQKRFQQDVERNTATLQRTAESTRDDLQQRVSQLQSELQQQSQRAAQSQDHVQRSLVAQQQAIDNLQHDMQRSHNNLEQRMNAIAHQLLDAVAAVSDSLKKASQQPPERPQQVNCTMQS